MKRHKELVDASARNSDAQVFVFPPDILEQLGIQLSGITAGNFTDNSVVDCSTEDNGEEMPCSADGPSILETANLMKQSVFMSPTFISTNGPETANELNEPNIVSESDVQENKYFINKNFANKNDLTYDDNVTLKSIGIVQNQPNKKHENTNMVLTNESFKAENNIDSGVLNKTSSVDDHADEAYASDCSNSNPGTGPDMTNNNKEVSSKKQNTSNKIKILSEQVINHSDLSSIQSSQMQKSNACFLIPVNTIVTGKATKHHTDIRLQAKKKKCVTPVMNTDNTIKKEITKENLVVDDSVPLPQSASIASGDTLDDAAHKIKTDYSSDSESKETDIPLNTEDQLCYFNVNKNKELILYAVNDTTKEIVSNNEQNLSKSKLCIQGVEKPGGIHDKKTNPVLKTYQRTNIQKQVPDTLQMVVIDTNVDLNILPTETKDLDNINIGDYLNANKFCLCHDFGQLANYESDIDYEHIHFRGNNSVGCNLKTLFSMYDDSYLLREFNVTEDIDTVSDEKDTANHNICYINDEDEEHVLQVNIKDEPTSEQLRRSNRKRKSIVSEHVIEKIELKSKKTVKCGVCGCMLSEAEWNKHKDSEHNSIAWKEGQTIVENTSSTIECKTLHSDVQGIKNISPKTNQPSRRSSRNIGVDISEISADNTGVNRNDVTSQNKIKLTTNTQCIPIETAIIKQEDLSISKKTVSKSVEKDDKTSKSTNKLGNIVSPKAIKKDPGLEDIEKSNKVLKSSVSCSKPLVKSLEIEVPAKCARQSKIEHTGEKNALNPKSDRKTIDLVSKYTDNKNSSNAQVKDNPQLKKTKKDDSVNAEPTTISKSKRMSTVSDKSIDIKSTSKSEIKETSKSTRKSMEVTSIKVVTSESTRKSISVEVPSKSAQKDVSLKASRKSVDDAGHSKQSSSKNNHNTNSISDRVDDSNKSIKKNTEPGILEKNIQKSNNEPTPKRKLKDIDLFSSPTAAKSVKIDNQTKSSTKSKDGTVSSSIEIIASTSKSSNSIDTSSKRSRRSLQIDDSNTKNRKSIDTEAIKKAAKAAKCEESTKSLSKSADVDETPKPLRQYTRKKNSRNTDITTPKENKNIDTPLQLNTRSQLPTSNSKRKSADTIQSDTVSSETENDNNPKSRKKSLLPPLDPSQNLVEIEIPVYASETATTLENAETITTQGVDSLSSSNSENAITDLNKENSSNPQVVVSIKEEIIPKCGVCNLAVEESLWINHIAKEHDYLAWREDETPLDLEDDEEIRAHLYKIAKANGGLTCSKCNVIRKYAKSFLTHIRSCQGNYDEQSKLDASTTSVEMDTTHDPDDIPLKPRGTNKKSLLHRSVECGVCSETVLENKWIDHIRIEHKYLAWKKGEPPLDLNDDVAVKDFLKNISKYHGGLICSKCGTTRSYVKKWMDHEATCKGDELIESSSVDDTAIETRSTETAKYIEIELLGNTVKCGKCSKEIESKAWIDHIEKEHNYLSWIEGQTPLDESDQEAVSAYLHALVKKRGSLYCVKCGVTRRYPKAFLTHVNACEISGFKREDFYVEVSAQAKPGEFECAVCHETGKIKDWKKHAMSKHYNVAWMAGDIPINLKNFYAVEKHIKEYRAKHNLLCKVCGASRASCYGFYAHVLTCGKTDAELEHLMEMCDICNNKFLCIYRNQHKAMHKEQMIKKEKKEQDAIRAEEEIVAKAKEKLIEGEPMGKRRAAEKAKKVMEKYTSNAQAGSHMCLSCHIEFDNEDQLKSHECQGNLDENSDSDVSVKLEGQEESEDDMEGVDSNISDEEEDSLKRKRQIVEMIPKVTLPYKVKNLSYHLLKSFEDFCQLHYTTERLFSKWQSSDLKILSEHESATYLPSLLESCKLRTHDDEWFTLKRFEAQKKKDITIFTGASIRCIQWVPHGFGSESQDHYLSVASFRDSDCPRYGKDELPEHPGMIQFWNMEQFKTLPKLEMALVHDYGTIWAMDWCQSGARDELTDTEDSRLGLLAVACSNGCAYIFSVPSFHNITQNKPTIFKLKPAAELRLSVNHKDPPYRIRYQATSISWSPQRGHEIVMVGYADGTTAMYDLNTESSILKANEDGVDIFYPFQDALAENSTITGVALCASADVSRAVSGATSSSVTGATMSAWPRGPAVRSHLAASSVAYTPNWPAALLCSDDVLTLKSTNEMQWWGGGRRLGGACAGGACERCGRVCLTSPPFVRVLRAHPAHPDIKKQIVATMKMVPISRKRKYKLVNDDLGMILEPLTYDEAIKKYGLEFNTVPKKDQNVASKLCDNVEQCAERFPLSDMPAAAFCPTAAHHYKLAVASHAGFLFIIST